jgi:prophage maintenance system killer protein
MKTLTAADAAKAVLRRNTEEVQGKGCFDVFELAADYGIQFGGKDPKASMQRNSKS